MFVSQRSRKDLRDIKRKEILGVLEIHGGLCSPIDILEGSLDGSQGLCRIHHYKTKWVLSGLDGINWSCYDLTSSSKV